jgi:hypothetical protein
MNTKTISIAVVALIIGGAIGYFAHPASAQTGAFARGAAGTFTRGTGAAGTTGAAGGGFLTGTVAATGSDSITLNTRDGSSHVVLVTPSTTVSKTVASTLTDVSVGANVMVIGTTNSDGSVSATMIELRPATAASTSQTTPAQ